MRSLAALGILLVTLVTWTTAAEEIDPKHFFDTTCVLSDPDSCASFAHAVCHDPGTVPEEPADGEEEPPADGEEEPPADGEEEPPADGEEEPPADGEEEPPADGEEEPPADGEEEPPADGEEEPPADGEVEPPVDDAVVEEPPVEGAADEDEPVLAEAEPPKCRCDVDHEWYKKGEICVQYSDIGEVCTDDGSTVCEVDFSSCQPQSHNPDLWRCRCDKGYQSVTTDGVNFCEQILTTPDNDDCETCENNEGTCYKRSDPAVQEGEVVVGCLCPASRTGEQCDHLHLGLLCDMEEMFMRICYEPHERMNFSANALMATSGHGGYVGCRGKEQTDDSLFLDFCTLGFYLLNLPLHLDELEICGTTNYTSSTTTKKYENMITIQEKYPSVLNTDINLRVGCIHSTHADLMSQFSLQSSNGNDREETVKPIISMTMQDKRGKTLSPRTAILLGDMISLSIAVDLLDGYAGVKVISCTASNRRSLPQKDALTTHLITDSCPADGQKILNNGNNFGRFERQPNVVRTGHFRAFTFTEGLSVFIGCRVQLCTQDLVDECIPEKCNSGNDGNGQNRKRRSTEQVEETEIIQEFLVVDPSEDSESLSPIAVAGIVTMMLILAFALVIVSILLCLRMRAQNKVVDDESKLAPRPQKFGMSRMNPNLRI